MLWRTSEIIGYGVGAIDGSIGSINDLLFDDADWTLRWAVVDTGSWLTGRKVLLPPSAFGRPDPGRQEFPVSLTRRQVEDSPGISTDAPVSRQMEADLYDHYGWSPYWAAPPVVGGAGMAVPPGATGVPRVERGTATPEPNGDPHLRSVNEVAGYYIHATDEDIGHVEEFLVEDEKWVIRYMVVDTGNWLPGKQVLISPKWTTEIDWFEQQARVDLARAQIKDSPEYTPDAAVDRTYEERLHGYYNLPPYWY